MSDTAAGWLQFAVLLAALALAWKPLGDYMARVFTSERHARAERVLYRTVGVDPDGEQRWPVYARSVLAFSLVGVLVVYGLQRLQQWLPLDTGMGPVEQSSAWNTAISFVTNTNWQGYGGESAMSHLTQMAGLAVQNFVSAATGIAVAIALVRGFARTRTDRLGNFWVDLTRAITRILLPISVVGALAMVLGGVVQNFSSGTGASTLAGGTQVITGGPVASQEAIKELGTNGGGFYNANAAHPFEGPTAWVSLFQIFLIFVIPFALTRTFGTMVRDRRQGYAILGVMATLAAGSIALISWFESRADGLVPRLAGAAMEGKEVRFGEPLSALYAGATTLTSTGSVNSMHDSYTALGGGTALLNMLLGEVAPGGVGAGLYGMLVLAVIAVFVAGLMVGRTPEYLGKRLGGKEMTLASLYLITVPALVLVGTGLSILLPPAGESIQETGPHGLSEILYAFTSGANNNGSAFAGFGANTPYFNTAIGLAMVFGRFLPIILVLALAGRLAVQGRQAATAGTFPTHRPLFVGLLVAVTLVVVGLTYFPVLALGPLAEGLPL